MNRDEQDICDYLKSYLGQFVSGREIARRAAGKGRFVADPHWAEQALEELLRAEIVEGDGAGHYRLRPVERKRTRRSQAPNGEEPEPAERENGLDAEVRDEFTPPGHTGEERSGS